MLTLLFILVLIHAIDAQKYIFLQSLHGKVTAENYTYYSLKYEGSIKIFLKSKSGDADLYASQTNLTPTYEVESYDLSSTTCGIDHIDIPQSWKRPVTIGVYGHPSHEISEYFIKTYLDAEIDSNSYEELNFAKLNENEDIEEESLSLKRIFKAVLLKIGLWTLFEAIEFIPA